MPSWHSGLLTILPTGQWYLSNKKSISEGHLEEILIAPLGPCQKNQPVTIGLAPVAADRYRTRIRWKITDDTLHLTPLIGILTSGEGASFKGNRENFIDICKMGQKKGALVFVFTPDGVNWDTKEINGHLYHSKKEEWFSHTFPFPHVVYNRIPTRKVETKPYMQELVERFSRLENVTLYNQKFFDKHDLFTELQNQNNVASFLPQTQKLDTLSTLKNFSKSHSLLYLKPVLGRAGKGIMQVEKVKGNWLLRRVERKKAPTETYSTLKKLWEQIKPLLDNTPYIIQQGIRLASYQNRIFDIRVLVQKNGSGCFGVTGMGIRQAGEDSITTHVPRGGAILLLDEVLPALFGEDEATRLKNELRNTALLFAMALEKSKGVLGEMSMDLGVTPDGAIYFFEANAKPEKFDEPSIRVSSLENIISFAHYLSSQSLHLPQSPSSR
ncbi:YheC/YheD family endospore coat-associated protein [Brevibacillus daliensis]|uniref:YheC/YheD family endospore coat-associated protein n=1 Tax=Brevibacillus daliensis TaxID=2892995 RepID=UPI001E4C2072|nr:YheC/YheD family protein [Brevibacillus daliensis]